MRKNSQPQMNTDEHRSKTRALSLFICAHLWPKRSYSLCWNPHLESGPLARARIQQQVCIQRSRAALQAGRTQLQQLQFLQVVGSAEVEAAAIVVHGDFEQLRSFLYRNGHA